MVPVQKMPITEQVISRLKASIACGDYQEGKKLPSEQSLCLELKVGRSTLREAFRVLQTMGYIELKPGRGAFVQSTTGNEIVNARDWFRENAPQLKDFIEVREAIESLAIRIAIERGTEEEYSRIEEINEGFLLSVGMNDIPGMARLDEAFHEAIVNMTHNYLLMNINNLVSKEFRKYRSISFGVHANAESASDSHQKIVAALKARDERLAIESVVYHLNRVISDMESIISE
jgi:GntR family transcriptional repressor for pyruvate dehydrogenase complex